MLKKTILAGSLLFAGGLAFGPPAQAGYIMTLTQAGSNVVATGSGTIDLTGLSLLEHGNVGATIEPSIGFIQAGPVSVSTTDVYRGFTGPANIGTGGEVAASSGSGDLVGIVGGQNVLAVPSGYVSGSSLSSSATWDNQTFASLGATPGTYVWTWGGPPDDSFTLDIKSAAVPEPDSLLLLATALIGIGAVGWSRRRRA